MSRDTEASKLLPKQSQYSVDDFLQFHDEDFIRNAYRALLGREPDPEGAGRFLAQLRTGAMAKVEILGRIRYSPEGRAKRIPVAGLRIPFALRSIRRVPLIGPVIATLQYALRLPLIVRNLERLEAVVFMHDRYSRQRIDRLADEAETALKAMSAQDVVIDAQLRQVADDIAAAQARISAELEAVAGRVASKAERIDLRDTEARLRADGTALQAWVAELAAKLDTDGTALQARVAELAAKLDTDGTALQARVAELAAKLDLEVLGAMAHARSALEMVAARLGSVEQGKAGRDELQRVDSVIATLAQTHQVRLDALVEDIAASRTLLDQRTAGMPAVDALSEAVTTARLVRADVQQVWERLATLRERVAMPERKILDQERRLTALLDQVHQRALQGVTELAPATVARERAHLNDRYYLEFENRFRGTREDIVNRLRVYLPHIRKAAAGTADAPVLDIGCGRGEWLELLREDRLVANGVDNNRAMVAECRARELQVTEADALEFLRSLEPGSCGAVTAFHVIEHLSFDQMLALFSECWRVLQPGGVAIFETPNPENLVVGGCNFWYDPTHLRPLPPEPTRFALESRGFDDVDILRLHPAHDAPAVSAAGGTLELAVHARLYDAQDYALIGYRT